MSEVINSKKCSKCGEVKPLSEFHKHKSSKDGYRSQCKKCRSEENKKNSEKIAKKNKERYQKNKKKINANHKIYASKNRDKLLEYKKNYYQENKEALLKKQKTYRIENQETVKAGKIKYMIENKEYIKEWKKEHYQQNKESISNRAKGYRRDNEELIRAGKKKYYEENKEVILKKSYQRKKNRLKTDPEFKLVELLRRRVYNSLKAKNAYKNETSLDLLGCSPAFYMKYLESKFTDGMSWDKLGMYGIHIDHIKPCCSFDLSDPEEQKKCFHYTNTQPLWAIDNMRKGGRY